MGLEEKLKQDMATAMKAGDREVLETIRMLRAQLKNASIAKGGPLEESDVLQVLGKEAKKRKESVTLFEQGGRDELAQKEKRELETIMGYMPEPLSDEDLKSVAAEVIQEIEAEGMKDMGKVMKMVMPRVQGRADGKAVQDIVRQLLG